MLDRFEEFTLLINQINKSIQKIKIQELKKYGLKGSQMDFIYYLGKNKELSFKEFSEVLKCDKAFVSRNLAALKEKKLIVERLNLSNKTIFSLSEEGFEIYKLNRERTAEICQLVYIDDEEIDEFYKNLNEIASSLQKIGEQ